MLKVHYTLGDFLRTPLVPVLRSDVAAGATSDIHLVLVTVVAMRAFPNELAVIFHNLDFAIVTADLTVVTLSVQLCVHDVVVDELHDSDNSFKVILHVRNLNIADSTARRQALEFALKSQLAERINLLPYRE